MYLFTVHILMLSEVQTIWLRMVGLTNDEMEMIWMEAAMAPEFICMDWGILQKTSLTIITVLTKI
jgi:hypothetical protein